MRARKTMWVPWIQRECWPVPPQLRAGLAIKHEPVAPQVHAESPPSEPTFNQATKTEDAMSAANAEKPVTTRKQKAAPQTKRLIDWFDALPERRRQQTRNRLAEKV